MADLGQHWDPNDENDVEGHAMAWKGDEAPGTPDVVYKNQEDDTEGHVRVQQNDDAGNPDFFAQSPEDDTQGPSVYY